MEKVVVGLISIGFVIAIGLALLVQLRDTQTVDSAEYNATNDIINNGVLLIVGFIGIIALAAIAGPLLKLVRGATGSMEG